MFSSHPGRLIATCSGDVTCLEAVAQAALPAGVTAVCVCGPESVALAKRSTHLPVVAVCAGAPDFDALLALAAAGADVIALEATAERWPVPAQLAAYITWIRTELKRPVLAQVCTAAEGERAVGYGAEAVACGDLAVVRSLARTLAVPVVYQGACAAPGEARAALEAGAAFVAAPVGVAARVGALVQAMEQAPALAAEGYWAAAGAAIAGVMATQATAIRVAAQACAQAILAGGVVHIFGAGHSRAFGMELSGRAGGLVPMHVFGLEEVAPPGKHGLQLLDLERSPETADALLAKFAIHPADVFLIASNSGRNGCPVELALEVKRRGHTLVAVTSLEHSGRVSSRHPSGARLFELADVVIDNGAPYGDALLTAPGLPDAVCAVSSVTGALIAQALTAEIIRLIQEAGVEAPVYISANVDGADEHNAWLEAQYAGRI